MNTNEEKQAAVDAIMAMRNSAAPQQPGSCKVMIDRRLREIREARLFKDGDYHELMTGVNLLESDKLR